MVVPKAVRRPNTMKAEHAPSRPDRRRDGKPAGGKPKQPRRRPPHPGENETISARRVLALELRKAGATYRQIAVKLGTSVNTAWADVNAELRELRDQTKHEAQDLRDLELQRCDAMTAGLWSDVQKGKTGAVMAAVRVSERRARLVGLDAATKTELSGSVDVRSPIEIKEEAKGIARYLSTEDLHTLNLLDAEMVKLDAEIEKIWEPARQVYFAVRAAGRL